MFENQKLQKDDCLNITYGNLLLILRVKNKTT